MIQVPIGRGCQLQCAEANIIKRLGEIENEDVGTKNLDFIVPRIQDKTKNQLPHCQCSKFRRCSQQADGQRGWRYKAQRRCRTPMGTTV